MNATRENHENHEAHEMNTMNQAVGANEVNDIESAGARVLAAWHQLVRNHSAEALDALLADDAVFHSPVVHRPQVGRALTHQYLSAAFHVFFNPTFRYVRETVAADHAVLEFQVEMDGIGVNGVDMISWNAAGKITEFKVMLRPLKAINLVHQKMAAMLQGGQA